MSEFKVDGPTPGLCIHVERRQVCTRMLGHDGEHILVPDTLSTEERFLAIAARFPVTNSEGQEESNGYQTTQEPGDPS